MRTTRPLALAILLALGLPISAQTPPPPQPQAAQVREPDPDPALLKAMRSRVFEIKYRSPSFLVRSLSALGSGVRGVRMDVSEFGGLNTITVRDFPENLAAIEEAIKRLDVPAVAQQPQDVDLQIMVLFASRQAIPEAEFPKDCEAVMKNLRDTLGYRGYTLAAGLSQRVRLNGDRLIQGRGQIDGSALGLGPAKDPRTLVFEWGSDRGIALESPANSPSSFSMRKFQFTLKEADTNRNLAELETGLTLKEKEHVVVGTSVVKDHGVIVVLTVKRVN